MQKSFKKNYLKVYLLKGISLILNLISVFVILPHLSSKPIIFGVYSLVISFTMFFNYADLGFLSAGYKYAAEYYAQESIKKEIDIIGFVSFILLIFTIIFSVTLIGLAQNPNIIVKNLSSYADQLIISRLLIILGIFTPVYFSQRIFQIIFGVRVEDYVQQIVLIIASTFKIISIFYFFSGNNYDIVGYFLFVQIMNVCALIASFIIVKYRYKYDLIYFIKNIHFSKKIYRDIKGLAFNTLFISLCSLLFFELDSLVISKVLGAKPLAIFAIGVTIASFLRNFLSILYSPFNARFNHFAGVNDFNGLEELLKKIIITMTPFIILPIISIIILIKSLVISWVGNQYLESIPIALLLIIRNMFSFINIPTGSLLVALEKIKLMYWINTIYIFVYWIGIMITINLIHIYSFPIFKLISTLIMFIFYFNFIKNYLKMNFYNFLSNFVLPLTIPIIIQLFILLIVLPLLPYSKSSINLFLTISIGAISVLIGIALYAVLSKTFRKHIAFLYEEVLQKWNLFYTKKAIHEY